MVWETLVSNTRLPKNMVVVVGSGGILYVNAPIMRGPLMGVKRVSILYDKEARRFAIKPEESAVRGSFRVNFSNWTQTTGVIAARSAVRRLGLNYEENNLAFDAFWSGRLRAVVVELGSCRIKPRIRRKQKREIGR